MQLYFSFFLYFIVFFTWSWGVWLLQAYIFSFFLFSHFYWHKRHSSSTVFKLYIDIEDLVHVSCPGQLLVWMIIIFICKQEIRDCVNSYMNFYFSIFAGAPQLAGIPWERKGKERNGTNDMSEWLTCETAFCKIRSKFCIVHIIRFWSNFASLW